MSGKCRPSLRQKTLDNVRYSNLSETDKKCITAVFEQMQKIPTIDAVPVVRCKDCEHLEFSDFYGECGKGILGIVQPWDYCSRGERKDGEW